MDTTPQGVSQQPIAPTQDLESQADSLMDSIMAEDAKAQTPEAPKQQAQPEAKEAPEAEEDEGPEFDSLEDFLTKSKLDAGAFHKLPVTVKVDGEEKRVTLQDVIKSYQLEGHVNNKSIELSTQQKAFEAERAAAQAQYKQHLDNALTMGKLAYQQLLGEYSTVNWEQLKAQDPISWAIKSQEFQTRNAQIQGHLSQVNQAREAEERKAQEERAANLPKEQERLYAQRPEWRDPAKFAESRTAMQSAAKSLGFSDAEIGAITDHRQVLILDLAARYLALQSKAPEAVKKVRAAPVMAKGGSRVERNPSASAQKTAWDRWQANPRDSDAAAAYAETLVG